MQRKWRPTKKYWSAYKGLYGEQTELGVSQGTTDGGSLSHAPKKRVKRDYKEQREQIIAVTWMRKRNIAVHHSPNGGRRNLSEGLKFKQMGTSAGYPDLVLNYKRKGFGGLYIEMKTEDGKLADTQIWWRDFLIKEGYAWYLARSANECIRIVCDYLNLTEEGIARE